VENKNIAAFLDESAGIFSKRVALIFGARKITYKELLERSQKVAAALSDLGVKKGDRVVLWLPNCPDYMYSFFGIARLGAIVVPIDSMLKREEAKFIIQDSGAKILICSVDKYDMAKNISSRVLDLKEIICVPYSSEDGNSKDFKDVVAASEVSQGCANVSGDDIVQIVYTSGTTGKPKGVCLTHKNIASNLQGCARAIYFNRKDCLLCILPLFHSFASTVCMLLPLSKGARIVLMRSVRPFKRVIRAIFKHKVSIFIGVPSLYSILNEIKLKKWQRVASVIFNPVRLSISGAAALPGPVWEKFEKKFKRPLLQGYGLTEASPVVSLNPLKGKRKPESIGLPLENVEIRIVAGNGEPLPPGEVGELIVRGPNVMKGYYRLERETAETLKGGWLYTGDLAKKDSDGYTFIMGRSKDMINVRGFNVYPREIEDLLYGFPNIKEAAVVGISHRRRGEVPVAFVVSEGGINEPDVMRYLRANLASYKVPLKIFFQDSLPKNAAGKILKRLLREKAAGLFL
jgi:long-chain acyl-CoA synthetase